MFFLGERNNLGNLWFERAPFDHNTRWDSGVADFQALSGGAVYVLGGDSRLWFETAPFPAQPNRTFIASDVIAFQAIDEHNVFVQLTRGEVWKYRL